MITHFFTNFCKYKKIAYFCALTFVIITINKWCTLCLEYDECFSFIFHMSQREFGLDSKTRYFWLNMKTCFSDM